MKTTMKRDNVKDAFGRILAAGYKGGAVSTRLILEEISHLARLNDEDGCNLVTECIQHRDAILANAGIFGRKS